MAEGRLQGCAILVVEDEHYLAMDLKEELAGAGAVVQGPVPTVEDAMALIEQTSSLNGAVLDVNLGGTAVYSVADRLRDLDVPFLFVTGYQREAIPARHAEAPCLGKPVDDGSITNALARLLHGGE